MICHDIDVSLNQYAKFNKNYTRKHNFINLQNSKFFLKYLEQLFDKKKSMCYNLLENN